MLAMKKGTKCVCINTRSRTVTGSFPTYRKKMPDWNAMKKFPVHPSEYPLLKSLDLQFVNKISALWTHDKWIPSLPDGD